MKNTKPAQIVFRAPQEFFERVDRIAATMSRPGLDVTRTDVLRMAAFRGLEAMESEAPKRKGKQ